MSAPWRAHAARSGSVLGAMIMAVSALLPSSALGVDDIVERIAAECDGRIATQVGEPGASMVGTSGDDVFVTEGASRVDTGAGDDAICVTGRGSVVVNAGDGDDFVRARDHIGKTFVSLGFGDDRFLGGKGGDRVWSQEASNQTAPGDRDEIYTGGGNDYVISGSSAAANADSVKLGPGDDVLVTYGVSGGASLAGGAGTNAYQPLPRPGDIGDWTFDNVTGEASLDGDTMLVWTSFRRFDLQALHGSRVRFLGSRASESVVAAGTCRVVLKGRSGNDRLTVGADGCNNLPAGDALLLGGPGDDLLYAASGDDVLRGGRGSDRADGGLGADRCFAETKISC